MIISKKINIRERECVEGREEYEENRSINRDAYAYMQKKEEEEKRKREGREVYFLLFYLFLISEVFLLLLLLVTYYFKGEERPGVFWVGKKRGGERRRLKDDVDTSSVPNLFSTFSFVCWIFAFVNFPFCIFLGRELLPHGMCSYFSFL